MSRRKKAIALILCGAIMLSILPVSVVHAAEDEAEKVYFDGDLFKEKDGFIQFDDTEGMFDWETGGGDYLTYLNESRNNVYVYSGYTYNKTVFTVVRDKLAEFQALYNEYNAQLQMDYYNHDNLAESNTATVMSASIHDIYNDMGEETLDPTEMENKMALIDEMAREMYRAGYIIDAEYSSSVRNVDIIEFYGINISYPEDASGFASAEELEAFAAKRNSEIRGYDENDGSCTVYCDIRDSYKVNAALKDAYPDANIFMDMLSDCMARFESSDRINLLFENKFSDDTDDRTGLVNIDESKLVSELSSDESEYEYITSYSDGSAPWKWGIRETDIYLVHYYDKAPDISGIEGAELLDHADYSNEPDYKLTGGRGISRVSDTSILVKGATAEELASLRYATMVCRVLEVHEKQCDPSEGDAGSVMAVAGRDVSADQFLEVPGVISAEPADECGETQQLFRVKFQSALTDGDTAAIMAESYENCKVLLGYDYVDTAYPDIENDLEAEPTAYSYKAVLENTLQSEDVDGDGDVTLTDAIEALRIYAEYAAGIETCYSDIMSADADSDGNVTLDDAVFVLTAYARKGAGLMQ